MKAARIGTYKGSCDPNGDFIDVDSSIAKIFGYDSKQDIKKMKINEFYPNPTDRTAFINEVKKKGYVKDFKLHLKRKNGKLIWISVTAQIQKDSKSNCKCIEGIVEDISEQENEEQKIEKLNIEIIKENKSLKKLVYKDSHTGLYNHRFLGQIP